MIDLLIEFQEVIIPLLADLGVIIIITFSSLAFVYIVGRMLELTSSFRIKNIIALICILGLSYIWVSIQQQDLNPYELFWEILSYASFSILGYVLIGFKLYDRIDSWWDKKGFKDKPLQRKKKKKKKK